MSIKSTLVCIHCMPSELEMFERFMVQYRKALSHLDENDDVTIRATLNLNPELTDWEGSELKQDYFVERFNKLFDGIKNINDIVLDTSIWGTTQQKRESIDLGYDQLIFCDTDIMLHEYLLKYQLNVSYQLDGMYIVSPSIPRWWDESWDIITHSDYMDSPLGCAHSVEAVELAYTQPVDNVQVRYVPNLKFGCGMHTLYSTSFWQFVEIPLEFGGYGPEDTYGMTAGQMAVREGYQINQVVLDGIYITEDTINRIPTYFDKIKPIDRKREFYSKAESFARDVLIKFAHKMIKNNPNN